MSKFMFPFFYEYFRSRSNPAALPPLCPQSNVNSSQMSEDCLYVVLYVPHTAKTTPGGTPTLCWVHGGSYIVGGATDPGLDGSNLAVATNSVPNKQSFFQVNPLLKSFPDRGRSSISSGRRKLPLISYTLSSGLKWASLFFLVGSFTPLRKFKQQ